MYLLKLIKITFIDSYIILPIKIISYYILGILFIYKWETVFNKVELITSSNHVSFWKTIYLNYRSLPKEQAKYFPIHVYNGTQLISTKGKILIENSPVKFGMIKWGWFHSFRSQGKTRIQNNGLIKFRGSGKIFLGCEIVTWPNATLTIGNSFFIGENVLLYCQNSIYMSESVRISYQCDISDSDFHYCVDVNDGIITRKNAPIYIGAYNWIANRTTVKKGTVTPDHTIVASANAVLSKDYTKSVEPFSILGGCPAKVIKTGISRIWHDELANIARIDGIISDKNSINIPKADISKLIQL